VDRLSNAHARGLLADQTVKKMTIKAQVAESIPAIIINDHTVEMVDTFTYLGSTNTSLLFYEPEVNIRIIKAIAVKASLKTTPDRKLQAACLPGLSLRHSPVWQ